MITIRWAIRLVSHFRLLSTGSGTGRQIDRQTDRGTVCIIIEAVMIIPCNICLCFVCLSRSTFDEDIRNDVVVSPTSVFLKKVCYRFDRYLTVTL